MYHMRSGMGSVDCGSPPLMSDFTAGHADCQLGQGGQTAACLALQDNTEQAFVQAQAAWNACKGSVPQSVTDALAMQTYGAQVYGSNAPAAAAQSAAAVTANNQTPQVPPPPAVVISSSPTMPAVPVVIQSSGASTAPPASSTYNSSAPPAGNSTPAPAFSFSSIPWWGWAGAAAVGLLAMSGKH